MFEVSIARKDPNSSPLGGLAASSVRDRSPDMIFELAPMRCFYSAEYLAKGGRTYQRQQFYADCYAKIGRIAHHEASVAFRIHGAPATNYGIVDEILAYGSNLWWPLMPEAQFLHQLASGEGDVLCQLGRPLFGDGPTVRLQDIDIRMDEPCKIEFDESLAEAGRKIASSWLLCEGTAYLAMGEPIYALSRDGINVTASGCGRPLEVLRTYVRDQVATIDEWDDAYRTGQFMLANETELLQECWPKDDTGLHSVQIIEIVLPEYLRIRHEEIQMDATLREAVRFLSNSPHAPSEAFHLARVMVEDLFFRDRAGPTTNADRLRTLAYVLNAVEGLSRWSPGQELANQVRTLLTTQEIVHEDISVTFSEEDNEAISEFAL